MEHRLNFHAGQFSRAYRACRQLAGEDGRLAGAHIETYDMRGELEAALGVISTGLGARTIRCITDESLDAFVGATEGVPA